MRKLKHIHIVLENCEVLQFELKDIKYFNILNITKNITFVHDYLNESLNCEEFFLELKTSANKTHNNISGFHEAEELPFDRITSCKDIVSVDCMYDDESSENVYVPYGEESQYRNEYQTVKIDVVGNLLILISKTRTVDDI